MSNSSLWIMDKKFNGEETIEFRNSWLFAPMMWGVLLDKYMAKEIQTPYGYKKNLISDSSLFKPLNDKINNCDCFSDRICWEMGNQQVFFTKDKNIIAQCIREFITNNSKFDISRERKYPLEQEHIIQRFNDIADEILKLDENKTPYFIFKNTSCDDDVEYWFSKYDEESGEYEDRSLKELDKRVTEFVTIEKNVIKGFTGNVDYFSYFVMQK